MKKTFWLTGTVIVLALFVALSIKVKNTEEYVVKVGYAPNIGFLPLHIADKQGFFTKEGVKVQLVPLQSAQQLYEALVRRELDYVPFLSTVVVMNGEAISPGNVKLVSVSDISLENQFDALMVKKDSKINSLNELRGKKIGVFPGTTGMNFLKEYFKTKNIDFTGTEFVQLPPPSQLQALESGSIDALFSYEPNYTIGVEKFGFRKIVAESIFASLINHAAFGGYWFSTSFATEHPDLANKVSKAMNAGNNALTANPAIARSIAKTTYSLDDVVAEKINLVKMVAVEDFKPEMFTSFTDFLVSIGELKTKPDLSNIFYK
jgi:ABC-type nitrate/sulfonate/bicarbonate transport system substrate-binding protein